jgi:hypothetical protein
MDMKWLEVHSVVDDCLKTYVSTASMDGSLKMWNAPTSFLKM